MAQPHPTVALAGTVRRYLDALGGAAVAVRRQERSNCSQLLRFVEDAEGKLDADTVEAFLEAGEDNGREQRLTTVRRLVALTPGSDADLLATWIDQNRDRLVNPRTRKVVPIRPANNDLDRDLADRFGGQARELLDAGELQRARTVARRALRLDPCCQSAHAVMGLADLHDDKPDAALRQFRQALVLGGDPGGRRSTEGIAQVLDGLGQTLMHVDCLEEAYEVYRRLRHASPTWATRSGTILGRICFLKGDVAEAADHFAAGQPIDQYSVLLCRIMEGDSFRAAIAFCRGLITNPLVTTQVLSGAEERFLDAFDVETLAKYRAEAEAYVAANRELWGLWPELKVWLRALWEHPGTRSFLMRAVPLMAREPSSPRLAVFVHQAATSIKGDWGL